MPPNNGYDTRCEHTVKRYCGCACGLSATDRTICLCANVCSASPELQSQIFLPRQLAIRHIEHSSIFIMWALYNSRGEVGTAGSSARSVQADLGGPYCALVTLFDQLFCLGTPLAPLHAHDSSPMNVPIQSPIQLRSMGEPSLQPEIKR